MKISVKFAFSALCMGILFSSCQTTYKVNGCAYLTNPLVGKKETVDAKVDNLNPVLGEVVLGVIIPKFFVPRKAGKIYVDFSQLEEGYSLNVNTYFPALIDDLERIKPENKLTLTLNDTLKVELSPREEKLGTDAPEAIYLLSPAVLAQIIEAKSMIFDFSYTAADKKSKSKTIKVNSAYLKQIQQRALCIK